MAIDKIYCPPQSSAANQFSNNLVGVQLVTGGGLTQANFNFTTGISEKQNRTLLAGLKQNGCKPRRKTDKKKSI